MADSGTGIQELMAAETRASQIVAEARIGESNEGVTRERRFFASATHRGVCCHQQPRLVTRRIEAYWFLVSHHVSLVYIQAAVTA